MKTLRWNGPSRSPGRGMLRGLFFLALLSLAGAPAGCGDGGGLQPGSLRYGQVGEIRLTLVVPLVFGQGTGELQQVLTWSSTGAWQLRESISYRGLLGDEQVRTNPEPAGSYISDYAGVITHLNETPGLKLFLPDLDPTLDPTCPAGGTRVSLLVWDEIREESTTWVRCAQGSLGTLVTQEAGPDAAAVRVIQAALLVREGTQRGSFASTHVGSVPFGTLDRGEDSGREAEASLEFHSTPEGSISTPPGWVQFWREHKRDPAATPPVIDWRREIVLVAAVGRRSEAGDSVEIRRILQIEGGTQVELVEQVPGDFCSPAAREQHPFHIVVAPRTRLPVEFLQADTVRVSCGV